MKYENLISSTTTKNNSDIYHYYDTFTKKNKYMLRKYGEYIIYRTEQCDYKFISLHVFLDRDEYDKSESRHKYLISKYKFWKNIILKIDKIERNTALMVVEVVFHSSNTNVVKNQIKILSEEKHKISICKF